MCSLAQGDPEFRDLLNQARQGDGAAMHQLVAQYEVELTRIVKAQLGKSLRPYLDSVDLVQSVHKSVLMGIRDDKFDLRSPQHLVRLASLILRRKIARKWKRHRRQLRVEDEQAGCCDEKSLANLLLSAADPSIDPTEDVELSERLTKLLNRLEPIDRRLIELRLEGCNTAEAARLLDLNSDILRARLGRLRNRLESCGAAADWF